VALLREWIDLGRNTFQSIDTDRLAGLYSVEWPETKKALIADHSASIAGERRFIKRWLKTVSAIFFGLAKRLAPHRRILFVLAQVAFFLCLFSIFTQMSDPPFWTFVELAVTFLLMTLLLAMELIDKIKMRDELVLARELQSSLIPKVLPQTPSYELGAFNHIANTVGGDIYDFVPLPDGRLAVLFGDASGHGMAAGLVMAVAHASFRTQLEIDPSPGAITASLNRILCRTGGSRSFFSSCYLLFETDGRFVATLAGHPQIVKLDASGKAVERIGRGAYPLGVKTGITWDELQGSLARGERLLLHSDGLTESRNALDVEFGDALVETVARSEPAASAAETVASLVSEWKTFTAGKAADDDVSIAVIRRRE
jgi:serine phosphatase RsbU (regulator of sigma subunit)